MKGVVMVMTLLNNIPDGGVKTMVTTPPVALLPTWSAATNVRVVPMVTCPPSAVNVPMTETRS